MDGGFSEFVPLTGGMRLAWAAALCAVLVLHVRHAHGMARSGRWWHGGHSLMAGGMALMYLFPRMEQPGLHRAGTLLFAVTTLAALTVVVGLWRHRRRIDVLWFVLTLDTAVMTYMTLAPSIRPDWLSLLSVGYAAGMVPLWGYGLLDRFLATDIDETVRSRSTTAPWRQRKVWMVLLTRASLAVMAASMAHMLAAM